MPEVCDHVAEALDRAGLTNAFPIQAAVVPIAATGRDVLAKAPTGSGKTLAFGLPIIEQLERRGTTPKAVILVPTRELAAQVCNDLNPLAWAKQIRCVAVFGGAPMMRQAKRAADAPIIVATPGRLADFMNSRLIDLREVEILVLDEADRMLDMGFQPQVDELAAGMPGLRQTMLFSATLDGKVGKLARAYTNDPETIENSVAPGEGGEIEHIMMGCQPHAKVDAVMDVLSDEDRDLAVVFVRTQKGAENLKEALRRLGPRATAIHGGMSQPERMREFKRFQSSDVDVLVATDVFARGMDLDRITHVINYEIPEDADTYRHRTGRTGRAGRTGTAVTLVAPNQRKTMARMAYDAELPKGVMHAMRKPSGIRYEDVPAAERYTDPPERDRRYSAAKPGQNRYSKSGGSGYQGKSPDKKYSRDDKPSYGKGNGRGDRPGYQGSKPRPESDRNERPTFKRDERPSYNRDDRPAYKGGKPEHKPRTEKPSYGRPDKPAFNRGNDRPAFNRGADRPAFNRGSGGGATNAGAGSGVITNYNADKGFGFIEQSGGGKDVFFHRNVLAGIDKSRIKSGLTVKFALEPGTGSKLRAKGVTVGR